ncbi:hypothetical protein KY338_01740 [Candidatus Woesearchaeota archaeon]|nr:hypothetical protein [Candidatus Woesearchaeota archaeon]MBW3006000.1 hypothetical protein [Candidatus Woesearchaeota archaeon]
MRNRSVTFADLIDQKTWTDYGDFVREANEILEAEVKAHIQEEKELIAQLKAHPTFKKLKIKSVKDKLPKAEALLLKGDVVGVDGTRSDYRLLSGLRCQIGVVAVNYVGEKIRHSFFISEASLKLETEDIIEKISGRARHEENLSDMAIRGLMLYREREAGLDPRFKDKYIMFHGPLLPFELMSGLGRLRALDTTLDVLRRIIREKRFFSVISSTSFQDFLTFGRAIEPFQYFTIAEYTLGHYLQNTSNFMKWKEKWRADERKKIEEFLRDHAEKILIGVIRIGERPYVFHAHEEIFDLAAAIIARDALFQKEKGFPLLIDYADTLCSQYFSSGDFKRMMEWELSRTGQYLSEAPERDLRLK